MTEKRKSLKLERQAANGNEGWWLGSQVGFNGGRHGKRQGRREVRRQ